MNGLPMKARSDFRMVHALTKCGLWSSRLVRRAWDQTTGIEPVTADHAPRRILRKQQPAAAIYRERGALDNGNGFDLNQELRHK